MKKTIVIFSRSVLRIVLIGMCSSGCVINKSYQQDKPFIKGTIQNEKQLDKVRGKEIDKRIRELRYDDDNADIVDEAKAWLIKNKEDTIPYMIQALEKYKMSKFDKVTVRAVLFTCGVLSLSPLGTLGSIIGDMDYPYDFICERVYGILSYELKEEALPYLEQTSDDPETSQKLKREVGRLLKQIQDNSDARSTDDGSKRKSNVYSSLQNEKN